MFYIQESFQAENDLLGEQMYIPASAELFFSLMGTNMYPPHSDFCCFTHRPCKISKIKICYLKQCQCLCYHRDDTASRLHDDAINGQVAT